MSPHPSPARRTAALTALTAALALTACSPGGGAGGPGPDDPLRVATPYTVKNLDPLQQGLWAPEWGYGELLMRATEHGTVEPWLLAELTRESETEWRLTPREGVTFHNGRMLDAGALAAMLDTHLDENSRAQTLLPEADAEPAADGTAVTLDTGVPTPNVPSLLADEGLFPVFDAEALATAGDRADNAALAALGLYTGPFTVEALSTESLTLKRNENYWGGEVALPGVEVRFVPDGQARVLAVRNGEADLAFYPPSEALRNLDGTGVHVLAASGNASPLRGFVNTRGVLADTAVRQALALAIDHRSIAEDVMDGLYAVPIGMFPATVPYARQDVRTDTAAAAALLDGAGWAPNAEGIRERDGKPLSITVLSYSSQPDTTVIATAMQAQLAQSGFEVEVREVPANYEAMAEPAGWDVGLSFDSALGTTYDPLGRLHDFLHTDGQYNFGDVGDADLDALLDELSGTFDEARRTELLGLIQQHAVVDRAYALFITERPARVVAGDAYRDYPVSSVLQHVTAATAPS